MFVCIYRFSVTSDFKRQLIAVDVRARCTVPFVARESLGLYLNQRLSETIWLNDDILPSFI